MSVSLGKTVIDLLIPRIYSSVLGNATRYRMFSDHPRGRKNACSGIRNQGKREEVNMPKPSMIES